MGNTLPRSQPASGRAEPRTQASSLRVAGSLLLFSRSNGAKLFLKEVFILVFMHYCSCRRVIIMGTLAGPLEMGSQQANLGSSLIS